MPDRSRRAGAHRVRARARTLEVGRRLGTMLREARLAAGLRQADVAARGGVSQAWVSKMERGHGTTASVATWSAVASAVGAQLSAFLESVPGADRPRDFEHLKRQRLVIEAAVSGGWVARPEVALDRSRSFARSIDVLLEREQRREAASSRSGTSLTTLAPPFAVSTPRLRRSSDLTRRPSCWERLDGASVASSSSGRPTATVGCWRTLHRSSTRTFRVPVMRGCVHSLMLPPRCLRIRRSCGPMSPAHGCLPSAAADDRPSLPRRTSPCRIAWVMTA
jgi:transcriptional regulator with XRE-family HTH domain